MNRSCTAIAVMLVVTLAGLRPALAVPPTVTPSPGYDARLQEQRKAMSAPSPVCERTVAPFRTKPPHHCRKRKY